MQKLIYRIALGAILSTSFGFTKVNTQKSVYDVNETLHFNVTHISGDKDWIGIYPKSSNNDWTNVLQWSFVNHTGDIKIMGVLSGKYEARLFFHNSYKLENKVEFRVEKGVKKDVYKYPKSTKFTKRLTDSNVEEPSVENPSLDDVFGTKIKMVNKPDEKRSPYPNVQAWNSDMSLFRIDYRLYNAKTLEESPITRGLSRSRGRYDLSN